MRRDVGVIEGGGGGEGVVGSEKELGRVGDKDCSSLYQEAPNRPQISPGRPVLPQLFSAAPKLPPIQAFFSAAPSLVTPPTLQSLENCPQLLPLHLQNEAIFDFGETVCSFHGDTAVRPALNRGGTSFNGVGIDGDIW